jgi:hypothetical protein
MAAGYTAWKVNRHDPIEKLAENLWRVSGMMENKTQRQMVVVRLQDGRLIVHNAIALGDAEMAELEAFGTMAALVVPNGFHRQDALIWKQRYPAMKVYCPASSRPRVEKLLPVDGTFDDLPGDDSCSSRHVDGMKQGEGVMEVKSGDGTTLVYCDTILNMAPMGGVFGFLLAPTGTLSVPRATQWFFTKDKKALRGDLERAAAANPRRLLVGHGKPVTEGVAAKLMEAAARLG